MLNLVEYLDKKNYKVTVLTRYYDKSFKTLYPSKVKYRHLLTKKNKQLKGMRKIIDHISEQILLYIFSKVKFDVVIAIKEGQMMQWGAKCNAKKKLAWIHVDYNYLYWTRFIFKTANAEIKCMKSFDKVVCVSETAKQSVIRTIGDPGNLCVRYNPLNVSLIRQKALEKTQYVKSVEKKLFVAVGRLTEQKNFEMLLKCIHNISRSDEFDLWIVGDGPKKECLEELIRKYQLNNVYLLGNQCNPYPIMKQADWIVSSAVWESFGLVLQEAAILKIPVLTTRCPAIEEIFDSNKGIIVDNNEKALATAIIKILDEVGSEDKFKNNMEKLDSSEFYEKRLKAIEELWME